MLKEIVFNSPRLSPLLSRISQSIAPAGDLPGTFKFGLILLILNSCAYKIPYAPEDWESHLLKNWQRYDNTHIVDGNVGNNTRLVRCHRSSRMGQTLLEDLSMAVQNGITCLKSLGPKSKDDAAQLATMFDDRVSSRPITIYCGFEGEATSLTSRRTERFEIEDSHVAMAFEGGSGDFPGFQINLNQYNRIEDFNHRRAILFHEMLHLLQYRHFSTFEVPYLADACCFPQNGRTALFRRDLACNLLRDAPLFPSEVYFQRLAAASKFSVRGDEQVIMAAIVQSYLNKNSAYLMTVVQELYSSKYDPTLGAALGKAAILAANEKQRPHFQEIFKNKELDKSPNLQFTDAFGEFIANLILNDFNYDADVLVRVKRSFASVSCDKLTDTERAIFKNYKKCQPKEPD